MEREIRHWLDEQMEERYFLCAIFGRATSELLVKNCAGTNGRYTKSKNTGLWYVVRHRPMEERLK